MGAHRSWLYYSHPPQTAVMHHVFFQEFTSKERCEAARRLISKDAEKVIADLNAAISKSITTGTTGGRQEAVLTVRRLPK